MKGITLGQVLGFVIKDGKMSVNENGDSPSTAFGVAKKRMKWVSVGRGRNGIRKFEQRLKA